MFYEILVETIIRVFWIAIVVIPVLLLVEYFNHRYGDKLIHFFESRKRLMPFWAAAIAMLPGCNAAAAIALLYVKKLISVGTLVAAMIATSDEAIYVFIPQKFNFLPLFAAKFLLAIFTGFAIDFISNIKTKKANSEPAVEYCCSIHDHAHDTKGMFRHTMQHAVKIIGFVFVVLFAFNLVKDLYGINTVASKLLAIKNWQPALAGLFGLVPGCGTSVVLATLYTQGILTFGGALAGLSVASGDVLLILLANKISKKELAIILGSILGVSILAGFLVSVI